MNHLRRRLIPLVIATSLCSTAARADELLPYYVAPMGSYVFSDKDRNSKDGIGGTLALGAHLSALVDIEVLGSYISFSGKGATKNIKQGAGGFGTNLYLWRGAAGSGPFIHLDVQGVTKTYYHYGLGYDFMFSEGFGLRAEGLIRNQQFEHHEPIVNVGLRIAFGSNPPKPVFVPPPPPPPEEAKIEEPVAPPPAPPPPPPCSTPEAGQPITLDGCKKGDNIILRGVNFEFDKAVLTLNAKTILDGVSDALKRRMDIKVEIGGHTDAKGTVAYNKKLSQARAASVKTYLISKGISDSRMVSVGYGKIVAIADNDTDEGRALNRRVELTVVDSDPAAGGVVTEQPGVAPVVVAPLVPEGAPVETAPAETAPAEAAPAAAPAASGVAPMTVAIAISDYEFKPATAKVGAGGTVTWTNNDGVAHAVKFADGEVKIPTGGSYSRVFPEGGDFSYVCGIHPTMSGDVIATKP